MSELIAAFLALLGGGNYHPPKQPNPPVPYHSQNQPQPVPEPTTILGSAIALGGLAYLKKKNEAA